MSLNQFTRQVANAINHATSGDFDDDKFNRNIVQYCYDNGRSPQHCAAMLINPELNTPDIDQKRPGIVKREGAVQ